MLIEMPKWSYRPKNSDSAHFNVYLYNESVIGSWFRISFDGKVHWDKSNRHANRIKVIEGNTLIATHYRKRGCHAFDITSGVHLWSYSNGGLIRKSTYPIELDGREIVCSKGERLDLNTGSLVRRTPATLDPFDELNLGRTWIRDPQAWEKRSSIMSLILCQNNGKAPNAIADRYNLDHLPPTGLQCREESGQSWQLKFYDIPYAWQYSVDNICLCYPHLYFVLPENFNLEGTGSYVRSLPTTWRFLSFDLSSGTLAQDFSLGNDICGARIADANDDFVLISFWKDHRWSSSKWISLFELADSAGN